MTRRTREPTEDDRRRAGTSRVLRVPRWERPWPWIREPAKPGPPLEPEHPELPLFEEEEP